MTHAMIYDRASTQGQKDNYSRVNAHDMGIKIAEQNGFTWEYIKEIGSGTTLTGRPEMMKILDRIAAGEIQALIVQDLDRLARPEEAIIYTTIRQVIMAYNVIIYTHTSRIDLNNDGDDFLGDIFMAVAKKERKTILKRTRRSVVARAEQGRFIGGTALGYKIVYDEKNSDQTINENEAKTVKTIFNILDATGGNIGATAKKLNELGYTGKNGRKFIPKTVTWISGRKLYMGIFESKVTDKITHRPDLQIISVQQFERVQDLIKSRAGNSKDMGRRGHYIFTGFVVCGGCGGAMVAGKGRGKTIYQCANRRSHGAAGCAAGRAYSEHLILPPVINLLAELIQSQADFYATLEDTAAQYGKSITEEALEAAIQGEFASVRAGKERIIEAISLGILSNQEAAVKLAELRAQEQRLTVELSSIAEKTKIMAEWQMAIEALKGQDIAGRLYGMAEKNPIAFRRLLLIVFEPNSLRVKTERGKGRNKYFSVLEGYKLTEAMRDMDVSFMTKASPRV